MPKNLQYPERNFKSTYVLHQYHSPNQFKHIGPFVCSCSDCGTHSSGRRDEANERKFARQKVVPYDTASRVQMQNTVWLVCSLPINNNKFYHGNFQVHSVNGIIEGRKELQKFQKVHEFLIGIEC